jgi:hypothetical protein
MSNLLRDGYVKTRKPHKCFGCQETIPAGVRVYHQTCVDDGTAYDIYMCDSCREWCGNQVRVDYWNSGKTVKGCQDCLESETAFEGYVRECRADNNR